MDPSIAQHFAQTVRDLRHRLTVDVSDLFGPHGFPPSAYFNATTALRDVLGRLCRWLRIDLILSSYVGL